MKAHIRSLTDGAVVCGQRLRATQEIDVEVDSATLAHLIILQAAGDIAIKSDDDAHVAAVEAFYADVAKQREAAALEHAKTADPAPLALGVSISEGVVVPTVIETADPASVEHDKP